MQSSDLRWRWPWYFLRYIEVRRKQQSSSHRFLRGIMWHFAYYVISRLVISRDDRLYLTLCLSLCIHLISIRLRSLSTKSMSARRYLLVVTWRLQLCMSCSLYWQGVSGAGDTMHIRNSQLLCQCQVQCYRSSSILLYVQLWIHRRWCSLQ